MRNWEMLISFVLVAGMTLILITIPFLLRFKKQLPYRLLIICFSSIFFFLLYYFGYLYRSHLIGGIAFLFGNGMAFLWGPLFLHYIKSLAYPRKYVLRSLIFQLIPFAVNAVFISFPKGVNMLTKGYYFKGVNEWYTPNAEYLNILENSYVVVYFFISLRFIRQLKVLYSNNYSDTEGKDLAWCRQLVIALMFIVLLDLAFSVYELNYPPIEWNIGIVPAFLFVGLAAFFAYKGIWQSQILLPEFLLDNKTANTDNPQKEVPAPTEKTITQHTSALSGLSASEIEALKIRLYEVLKTEKPYLNDSLTLSDLAALIPISDKKLSELLNKYICTSFYDLINNYRVETMKEKMGSPLAQQFTLLALAYDSGFKSKTSFNRVFKQKTGVSPSQYYETSSRNTNGSVSS